MLKVLASEGDLNDATTGIRGAVTPTFPSIARWEIAARNSWSRRRKKIEFGSGEVAFALTLAPAAGPAAIPKSYVCFLAGGEAAALAVPARLIEDVLESFGLIAENYANETAISLLLLEHRFSTALDALEKSIGEPIAIDEMVWCNPLEGRPHIRLDACLCLWGQEYPVSLHLPPRAGHKLTAGLDEAAPPSYRKPDATLTVAFHLGATWLTLGKLKTIQLNDIILVDRAAGPGLVWAVAGKFYQARARYEQGTAVLQEPLFRIKNLRGEIGTMSNGGAEAGAADASFQDLEIKIVFEVGRTELRLEELSVLGAGHVFDLGKDRRTAVDIYAGERRIGFGEIVQINETFGVRVTRLFNNE